MRADAYRAGPITLWSAARELLSTDIRPKLAQNLPDAELVIIPGAGHNPMWDRPEAFNRLVADILDAS